MTAVRRCAFYYLLAACFIAPCLAFTAADPYVWSTTTLHQADR